MENNTLKDISANSSESQNNQIATNPIGINRIMPLNSKTSANRLYGGYTNTTFKNMEVDYTKIIKLLNNCLINKTDINSLFYETNNAISLQFDLNYSALGLFNQNFNYIDMKLIDKIGSTYNSKIMLNDSENSIIQTFTSKRMTVLTNSEFLKLTYLNQIISSPAIIIPLIANNEALGVFIVSDNCNNQHIELYKMIANYLAIFYKNKMLSDLVDKNTDTDSLTGLFNHKKLQESLSFEMENASKNDKELAFCIIDIANISEINNELGHAKGDILIKEVAAKIKKNVRNTDILGRYGGDKIAIVMPETSCNEAKYVAEFLLYNLSCTMFDDLGQLKFSCGIAMYPSSTNKQDKLNLLAQQALTMAKGKRIQSGQSEIVTTTDFNFWDEESLKCFVEILSKKHASLGVNLEEELIKQFHSETILSNEHMLDVVSSLANTIDAKDTYTKGHSSAVSRYSEALARACNLPSNEVERIKLGALLHDIGKIGIPEQVLRKPTKLTNEEWEIMKQHPAIGADKVLKPNKSLHDLIPIVKYHHEHIDGSGYPYGLKGDEIPLNARIVAVADAYHALISDRPYRKGLSVAKACEILKMGAGVQWDRELVRKFITIAPSLATNI